MHILNKDNPTDNAFLRTKTRDFDFAKIGKPEIRELIKTMREIMRDAHGVGLAANQIGIDANMFVAQCEGKFYAIFNPKITKTSKETALLEEGCLSVPGYHGIMKRYERVTLDGQDQNGKKIKIKAWGLLAQIFQHETDHLSGKLYIDKAQSIMKNADVEE